MHMLNQIIVHASIELDNFSMRGLHPFLNVVFDIQLIPPPYACWDGQQWYASMCGVVNRKHII